ncbi:MAG: hypothetical protein K6U75_17095 [Firmicutes bacterium]|nr:hypothetical protein [Bacillota bacterium]
MWAIRLTMLNAMLFAVSLTAGVTARVPGDALGWQGVVVLLGIGLAIGSAGTMFVRLFARLSSDSGAYVRKHAVDALTFFLSIALMYTVALVWQAFAKLALPYR